MRSTTSRSARDEHSLRTTVSGNLQVQQRNCGDDRIDRSGTCGGNIIGGNLEVHNNSAATAVVANTVSGNLDDHNNAGPTQVFFNVVGKNLTCQKNDSITASGNKATAKSAKGQCAEIPASSARVTTRDITSQFAITRPDPVLNPATNTFDLTVTLTNTSGAPVLAPILAVVSGLPSTVTLANLAGQTADGKPYVSPMPPGTILQPGATLSFVLKFANPQQVTFTNVLQIIYTVVVPPNAPSLIGVAATGEATAYLVDVTGAESGISCRHSGWHRCRDAGRRRSRWSHNDDDGRLGLFPGSAPALSGRLRNQGTSPTGEPGFQAQSALGQ